MKTSSIVHWRSVVGSWTQLCNPIFGVEAVAAVTTDEGEEFFADAVSLGFEGVVVKDLEQPYAAGRRGWRVGSR